MTAGRDHPAAKCNGGCCASFTLSRRDDEGWPVFLTAVDELGDHELRPLVVVESLETAPGVMAFARFGCSAWNQETRRCGVYPTRPDTCRRFPEERCRHCGAHSAAEAAGVALMKVEQP